MSLINKFFLVYRLELSIDNTNKNKSVFTSFADENIKLEFRNLNYQKVEIPFIKSSESYKYLGIYINLELDWTKQRSISWSILMRHISCLQNRCLSTKQITKILNTIVIPSFNYGLQFYSYPKKWAAKIERQLALLLSKYLHIPESSPLHFQNSNENSSFNLASLKLNQVTQPTLSLTRIASNNRDNQTFKLINNTLDLHLSEFELPPGFIKLVVNPSPILSYKLVKISWLLFDWELINKLESYKLVQLEDIVSDDVLIPLSLIKKKCEFRTNKKCLIKFEEYSYLRNVLCSQGNNIKDELIEVCLNKFASKPIDSIFLNINNNICIFTDGSEDEFNTGYAVYVGDNSSMNISENLPFSSNNRAELFSILQAIRRVPQRLQITIFSDSKISIDRIKKNCNISLSKDEDSDLVFEIKDIVANYKVNGGCINLEHIYSHLGDSPLSEGKCKKLAELQKKFPLHWESIIEGNKRVDLLAKLARDKNPVFKYPPNKYGSKLLLETFQRDIIQSGFKTKIKNRVSSDFNRNYKTKKPNQKPFDNESQKVSKFLDKKLMKQEDHSKSKFQDFLFKVKFNKLLTKINVRIRAEKYKSKLNEKYLDDLCPACRKEPETIYHLADCQIHSSLWKKTSKKISKMFHSFSSMSKHDVWREDWYPMDTSKLYFPNWFSTSSCNQYFNCFDRNVGRLGIIPLNIHDFLKNFGLKKKYINDFLYQSFLIILETLYNSWINRCKIFAKNYPHE